MEQVKTFGCINRHPAERVVTVAYYSLINIQHHKLKITENELHWHDVIDLHEFAFDHKQILDCSYEHLKRRVQEHPLAFSLLPKKFSLRELQNVLKPSKYTIG
jgi:8-oxo-dGTP diphosphatase